MAAPFFREASTRPLIFLLRHGQIETDGKKRFLGQTDIPLNAKGQDQAQIWAKALAQIPFSQIFSSSLNRCRRTAELVCPRQPIIVDKRLNEINMGRWDNRSFDFITRTQPQDFAQRGTDLTEFTPPGGESFQDLFDRCVPFFNTLETDLTKPVLVITHSGVIRTMVTHYMGKKLDRIFDISMGYAQLFVLAPEAGD